LVFFVALYRFRYEEVFYGLFMLDITVDFFAFDARRVTGVLYVELVKEVMPCPYRLNMATQGDFYPE